MTHRVGAWPREAKIVGAALGVGWMQAEILMAIAAGHFHDRICRDLDITSKCLMVHVSKLRRAGWNIPYRRAEVYTLSAHDSARVLTAMALIGRHVAPPGAGARAPVSSLPD